MGMTIEDAITWLNTDDFESKGFADATSVAIDIMRKYQKIQEYERFLKDGNYYHNMEWLDIMRVVEDENYN